MASGSGFAGGASRRMTRRRGLADRWLAWTGLHMSLAFKLAVPVVVTTSVLAVVMGAVVTRQVNEQIATAYDRQANSVAAGVEVIFVAHPSDMKYMTDYLSRLLASEPDLVAVRIHSLDARGTVIASGNPSEVGQGGLIDAEEQKAVWAGRHFQDANEGTVLTTVHPLRVGELLFGAVVITSSRASEQAAIRSLTLAIGGAAFVSIALESLFVLSALYLGIIRRTRRVQRAVDAVAGGDTSVRLPEGEEPRGRDEIFNLARTVDHMIATLDDRHRGDALIRQVAQKRLEGMRSQDLIKEALMATREALTLDDCLFASMSEDGSITEWVDAHHGEHRGLSLPVWIFALTSVAIETRKAVLTDRLGSQSRFADGAELPAQAHAAIVPLPRTSVAGRAIVAIAPPGETIPEGALAVIEAIAATIAESLHIQAAEEARAESAVKSKVMSAVSHEMRNPLNSILGFTGLVLRDPSSSLTDKQRRQLNHVQASANNMLTLVNNYLDLARLRGGSITLQYETARVAAIVDDVVAAIQATAAEKQVTIRTSVAAGAQARIDPARVRQVVSNLVSNAIKFTPPRGHVYIRARVDGKTLRIAVSDSGIGIPKGQREQVFAEFAKIDAGPFAASKGTGLGLTLTKALIVAMGGTIDVHSRPGRGSTFVIRLPRDGSPARSSSAT